VLLDRAGNVLDLADLLATAGYAALVRGSDRDAVAFVGRAIPLAERLDAPFGADGQPLARRRRPNVRTT
jgi:hypothetical protein